MKTTNPIRRLPLQGAANVRDLGGYPCEGGSTRWGIFLRSDSPADLTDADCGTLAAYGVTTAVDLRGDDERRDAPSALEGKAEFAAHSVTLCDNLHAVDFQGELPGSMAGLYTWLLDESAGLLAEAVQLLAGAEGAALFHCAAGKDRTGVVAMLLLKLAGVADTDVVADYSLTEIYMREIVENKTQELHRRGIDVPGHVFRSAPKSMRHTLYYLAKNYGTAEDYLRGAGVPLGDLKAIRAKFIAE